MLNYLFKNSVKGQQHEKICRLNSHDNRHDLLGCGFFGTKCRNGSYKTDAFHCAALAGGGCGFGDRNDAFIVAIAGNAMSVKNDPSNNYWIPQKKRTSAEDVFN